MTCYFESQILSGMKLGIIIKFEKTGDMSQIWTQAIIPKQVINRAPCEVWTAHGALILMRERATWAHSSSGWGGSRRRDGTDLQPGCVCQRCPTCSQSEQTACTSRSGFSLPCGWRGWCPPRWCEFPPFCRPGERHLWTRSRRGEAYPAVRAREKESK